MRICRAARIFAALGLVVQVGLVPSAAAQPAPKPGAAKAQAKPVKQSPPAKPGKKGGKHVATRKGGDAGEPDEAARRAITGSAGHVVRESPELRAMRELDRALFPAASSGAGTPWAAEGTPLVERGDPEVVASGMPPSPALVAPTPEVARDLSWLRRLTMPDVPVRWDARVVRYLEFYKNNPRGRSMVAGWIKKSGRYGGAIRRILRENNLPEDILWLALVESGFDPTIHSPAGAAGLWQFMPDGARIYGLAVDRWVDERLDPERSTLAAARYLADLHTRFGSWELAFAAYNMGYGGLLASIRKYNTNDFWELSRLESGMPLETALYVPKIVAIAIVARNRSIFGIDDVELDPATSFDKISVRPGVSLQSVALAAGTSTDKLAELNPQLVAGRAPPVAPGGKDDAAWVVHVPVGAAANAAQSLPKFAEAEAKVERYVVRWGESIDDIATRRRTTRGILASLNGLRRDESLRPGTVLLVPAARADAPADLLVDAPASKPVVVVPAQTFGGEGRRVFYKVVPGDTLHDVAAIFGVTTDEVCRWNVLDAGASLHDGMTLQIYPHGPTRHDVLVLEEKDAHVLRVGSPEFFSHFEGLRGRTRVELVAKQGDSWRAIAHKYGLSVAQLERINGRARSTPINPGEKLVVYVSNDKAHPAVHGHDKAPEPREKPPDAVEVTRPVAAIEDDTGALVRPATAELHPGVPHAVPLGSLVPLTTGGDPPYPPARPAAPASIGKGDAAASR